ncbi:MAG: invasin domain 3-containing protein, partial [Candidatus Limnocylindrus sp.]
MTNASPRSVAVQKALSYFVTINLLLASLLSLAGIALAANTTVYAGFTRGVVGEYSNNAHQPESLKTFTTLGINSVLISQSTDNGAFGGSGGSQGNDYSVNVTMEFTDKRRVSFAAAVNWRDTQGSTLHGIGLTVAAGFSEDGTTFVTRSGYERTYLLQVVGSTRTYVDTATGSKGNVITGNAATNGLLDALNSYRVAAPTTGIASGLTTQITASPTSILANGITTSTITVQSKDVNNNNITTCTAPVTLATTAGTLSAVECSNGVYTATLTSSTTVETATITGTIDGYTISDNATVDFTSRASRTITALTNTLDGTSVTYGDSTSVALSIAAGSLGTGSVTYVKISGDCTVTGTTATITGYTNPCVVQATKAADANYLDATDQVTITVAKASQVITFDPLADKNDGDPNFDLTATADSELEITYSSSTPAVCTVSGSTVTIRGEGTCTITASQPGNGNYLPASNVTQSFNVGPAVSNKRRLTASISAPGGVHSISISADNTTSCVVVGKTCKDVDHNASVTLSASPDPGYRFKGWSVNGSATECPGVGNCSVTMSSAKDVVAEFVAIKQLSVEKSGSGAGSVTASVASSADPDLACNIACGDTKQKDFDEGTEVTLTAAPRTSSPGANSRFTGWKTTGGSAFPGCETGNSCSVTMSEARSLVASFVAVLPLDVTIVSLTGGQGSVSSTTNWNAESVACGHGINSEVCGVEYDLNEMVTLTATAEPGSEFVGWEDITPVGTVPTFADFALGIVQSSNSLIEADVAALSGCVTNTCTVTMLGSTYIQATFQTTEAPSPTPTPTPTPAGAVCEIDGADSLTGDAPLTIHFIGANSTGDIASYAW